MSNTDTKKVTQKEQLFRFSDFEFGVLKSTFSEASLLTVAIRKVFLDAELDSPEKQAIRTFQSNEAGMAVLRKVMLPTVDSTAPLHQLVDLYVNIETKDKTIEQTYPLIVARDKVIDYINDRLEIIEGTKKQGKFTLEDLLDRDVDPQMRFSNLSARNLLLVHIDSQMVQIKLLAGLKTETPEETQNRLAKNSTK